MPSTPLIGRPACCTGFYGKRPREGLSADLRVAEPPLVTITEVQFKEYALANGYVVKKTSWYLTRLRKAIAARLIFPNAR